MNANTFRCALGKHKYNEERTKDKQGLPVHMCKQCNLHGWYRGYRTDGDTRSERKTYIDYYRNGNWKRFVWDDGLEWTFNRNGKLKSERKTN